MPRTAKVELSLEPVHASDSDWEGRAALKQVARGDAAAFEALVERHSIGVCRLVSRLLGWPDAAEVDDVVQEVFARVWMRADKFRGDASAGTWITAIAINACRSWQRRAWVRRAAMSRFRNRGGAASPPADVEAGRAESCVRVQTAVRLLRRTDREVITLHYLEGHASCEVARMLRISVGAVDVRLHRARQRLRELLGGDEGRDLL